VPPHCPSDDTGAPPVGVLAGGDTVDEADDAQDEGKSVMVVVAVDKPVTVCVTVWVGPTWVMVTRLEVVLKNKYQSVIKCHPEDVLT
jgi:hypothetical protein